MMREHTSLPVTADLHRPDMPDHTGDEPGHGGVSRRDFLTSSRRDSWPVPSPARAWRAPL
jgi:hypothetical protein